MRLNRTCVAVMLLGLAACADDRNPTTPPPVEEPPKSVPTPVGVYEFTLTGIGGEGQMSSNVQKVDFTPQGPSTALTVQGGSIVFEQVGSSSFTEGVRGQGGQRYISFTFRVRNGTGATLNNLTMMLVSRASTIAGTPVSVIKRFDGVDAAPSIAPLVIPTGAVVMGSDLSTMLAPYPDVIQVMTEAEIAAVALPGDVTGIFPTGYVVRSKLTNANRTLAATADANQFDGVLTLSMRLPLQASSATDVFSITLQVLAVTDSETRLTESIEEAQDTGAVRRLRDRATTLGATTVTVLNGSTVTDAAIPDYPGQRQICGVRTAGPVATPTTLMTSPAGYSQLYVMPPGEALNTCTAYFRSGAPQRPSVNDPFFLTLRAMDRYGNQKSVVDTVRLESASGPPVAINPPAALVGGQATISVEWVDYGTAVMNGIGKRNRGRQTIPIAGVTRTWTAGAGTTDWHTDNNWSPTDTPGTLDSVYIPVAAPLDPALAANVAIEGVTVEDVALIALGAFNLTANANVTAGLTGGITNTSGQLILTGTAKTLQGRVPRVRVTGTYSLTGNTTARAPIQVDAGRLTASGFRLQADGN